MANRILFGFSLILILITACGAWLPDERATETRIAAKVFATQTASVPTATPVPPMICPTPPAPTSNDKLAEPVYHTVMNGEILTKVEIDFQPGSRAPFLRIYFNSEGARTFGDYTVKNKGSYLAIVVNKKVILAPRIISAIYSGEGIIEGDLTLSETEEMQRLITACPAALEFVDLGNTVLEPSTIIQTIGP
jgi:preprotein translocase subunit SecD